MQNVFICAGRLINSISKMELLRFNGIVYCYPFFLKCPKLFLKHNERLVFSSSERLQKQSLRKDSSCKKIGPMYCICNEERNTAVGISSSFFAELFMLLSCNSYLTVIVLDESINVVQLY